MNFQLKFTISPFPEKINYSDKLFFIGSCFAENIGEKMEKYKINTFINPNGVIYNPASIAVVLRRLIENKKLRDDDLFFANDYWNSWEFHSRFSNPDKTTCLTRINNSIAAGNNFIKNTDWIFITLGSAFYYLTKNDKLVANCHKIPQQKFTKKILNTDEIISDYNLLFEQLKAANPKIKIILTISPVRYIRDGLVENNLSKARLIDAVNTLAKENKNVFYFPAYELLIDILRDYRFYKSDMVHPSDQAIEYIFNTLTNITFNEKTKELFEKVKEIIAAKDHHPFNTETDGFKKFKITYFNRCKELQKKNPFLNLANELSYFNSSM